MEVKVVESCDCRVKMLQLGQAAVVTGISPGSGLAGTSCQVLSGIRVPLANTSNTPLHFPLTIFKFLSSLSSTMREEFISAVIREVIKFQGSEAST